ncbi:MAG: glycosyltransferase family 4 protein [Synechococcaceae cyanobacterium SM2_3_1]|nr:glycosyltransferase family 4 protein [Synechococcaceae cyanobacterium SM2_3_1]
MILLSHPTGNQFVRHLVQELLAHQLLFRFQTTLGFANNPALFRYLPKRLARELQRRAYSIPFSLLSTRPWYEGARLLAARLNLSGLIQHEKGWFCVDAVYKDLDLFVAQHLDNWRDQVHALYGYEDGALESFRRAQALGIRCVYDLPIAYWKLGRQIQSEEAKLQPEWASTMPGIRDSMAKLSRKDEEIALADTIVVASTFTRNSLKLSPTSCSEVIVSPYGAPPVTRPRTAFNLDRQQPLKVLYVGSLSQRKGLSYVLQAIAQCGPSVRLTLIGQRVAPCIPLDQALQEHRWLPSVPHAQVLEEMRVHDVLLFPSLFEGFGLVILEAMAQGLPVITTANTGAPDVLTHGQEGFILPIRAVEKIAHALETLERDRSLLAKLGKAAQIKAKQLSWQEYAKNICLHLEQNTH